MCAQTILGEILRANTLGLDAAVETADFILRRVGRENQVQPVTPFVGLLESVCSRSVQALRGGVFSRKPLREHMSWVYDRTTCRRRPVIECPGIIVAAFYLTEKPSVSDEVDPRGRGDNPNSNERRSGDRSSFLFRPVSPKRPGRA